MSTLLKLWYFLLVLFGVRRPGKANPTIRSILENHQMADTMVYTFDLGPYDPDTEVREVSIAVEGVPQGEVVNVDPTVNQVKVSGPQDAKATITVIDVDDAGNKAVPVVHEQILLDTVAPSPGSVLTVVAVEEIAEVVDDPPAEDPPAEDPPAEDPPAEDPPAEDPPAEDPPAEDPPAEDPPAEDPPAEDPPAEDPPAEDPPAEDPPAEDPPAEDPPADEEPTDEEPTA